MMKFFEIFVKIIFFRKYRTKSFFFFFENLTKIGEIFFEIFQKKIKFVENKTESESLTKN